MNRVLVTFLVLLGLATATSGQLWIQSQVWGAGQGTWLDAVLAGLSALLLIASLLGLGRILYRTAPCVQQDEPDKEKGNA